MKDYLRRTVAWILTFMMLFTCMPMNALAAIVDISSAVQPFNIEIEDPDETKRPPYTTYVFHYEDGTEVTQILTYKETGDVLLAPATPVKYTKDEGYINEGYKFLYWYYLEGDTEVQQPVGTALEITATKTVDLYPKFAEVHYVFFVDNNGRVFKTMEGISGDTISTDDVTFPVDADEGITGWYDNPARDGTPVTEIKLGSTNVTLYAKVEKGHWITYNADGGSYTAPVFVAPGKVTVAPTAPTTREGYTFLGWYNGDTKFTFGSELNEDVTLTAKWQGNNNTPYTVIHWQENADDDHFSFKESETMTGTTGELTAAAAKSYDGFTAQTIEQKSIAGDGSTIVNVYYKRNTYEVKFYQYKKGFWGGQWNELADIRITAKYGANIKDKWPSTVSKIWGTKQGENSGSSPYQSGISTMPLGGDSFYYVSQSGKYTMNLHYYVQVLGGNTYKLDHTDSFKSSSNRWSTSQEDHYPITGFTYINNLPDGSDFNNDGNNTYSVSFYYNRNSYEIQFINNGSVAHTVTKQYEANISDVSYTPTRPAGIPEAYEFVGWFDNELGQGDEYVFSGTMPAKNITVYAKWAAPTYAGVVYLKIDGTSKEPTPRAIPYGGKIDPATLPDPETIVPPGYTWIGWTTRTGTEGNYTYTPFNFNTQIYDDISLYPYYVNSSAFTVTYKLNGGSGTAPVDSKSYAQYAQADVQSASGVTAPAGKVFLYWSTLADDGTGAQHYYPGDKLTIGTADVTLYAVFGPIVAKTLIKFDGNGGTTKVNGEDVSTVTVEDQTNNGVYDIAEAPEFEREGYKFLGWSKNKNATENDVLITAGSSIRVNKEDEATENVLYAIWTIRDDLSYTVNYLLEGTTTALAPAKVENNQTFGAEVTETAIDIAGYDKVAPTSETITIAVEGNVINFYYTKRTDLSYTVNYYWNNTEFKVKDSLEVNGQTYLALVTGVKPAAVEGYTPVSEEAQSITIQVSGNVINFYYYKDAALTANSAEVFYNGEDQTVDGYTCKVDGVETELSFSDVTASGTGKNAASYTVAISANTEIPVDSTGKYVAKTLTPGTLTIEPRQVTLRSQDLSKPYDETALVNGDTPLATETGWVDGQGAKKYTFTGSQLLVGHSENSFTYELKDNTDLNNYDIKSEFGILTVTDGTVTDPVEPSRVVVKTHEQGDSVYRLGDTVTFTITVTNIYDEAKDVTITELGSEAYITKIVLSNGTTLFETDLSNTVTYKIPSVGAGETVTITAVHEITSDDIKDGMYSNSVEASFSDGKGFINTDEVKPEDIDRTLTVKKTSVSADGETLNDGDKVELGQTIRYEIAVTNAGNVPYEDVRVVDELNEATILAGEGYTVNNEGKAVIARLSVGETVTVYAEYTVTNADLIAGSVVNTAVATAKDPKPEDGKDPKDPNGSDSDTRKTANPKLSMKKEADKQDVLAGESITYTLTVSNIGDGKATEVVVTDTLPPQLKLTEQDNAALAAGLSYDSQKHEITWNAGTVEANSEKSISFTATVLTESELDEKGLAMTISNHAEIIERPGPDTDPDPDDPDKDPDKDTEVTAIARVDVQKSAQILNPDYSQKNGGQASLGDIIRFNVVVTNKGGCDLENVIVSDVMIGKAIAESIKVEPAEAAVFNLGRSAANGSEVMVLNTLPVGQMATFTYDYRVTEEDILTGSVSNVATADARTENGTEVTGKGETNTTTDKPAPSLTIDKALAPKTNGTERTSYRIGESIQYLITVTNTGNVTVEDIEVTDYLTSPANETGKVETIELDQSVAPGESVTVEYTYTVQKEDVLPPYAEDGETVLRHFVDNFATVAGIGLNGTPCEATSEKVTAEAEHMVYIRFIDSQTGTILKGDYIPYGGSTTPPAERDVPDYPGYNFTGWWGGIWEECYTDQNIFTKYERREGWYPPREDDGTGIIDAEIPLAGGYISNVGDCFD